MPWSRLQRLVMTLSIYRQKSLAAGRNRRGDASHENGMGGGWRSSYQRKAMAPWAGCLWFLRFLLIALTFVIVPFINTVRLSFADATFSASHFVGLEQYQKMFSDESVHIGLLNSSVCGAWFHHGDTIDSCNTGSRIPRFSCAFPCILLLAVVVSAIIVGGLDQPSQVRKAW